MSTSPADQRTLIEELDARQDEVLAQLDELNQRIEKLVAECLADRNTSSESG